MRRRKILSTPQIHGDGGGSGSSFGAYPLWVDEVPAGPIDGNNTIFTTKYIPQTTDLPIPGPTQVVLLFKNGKKLRRFDASAQNFTPEGGDYSVSGNEWTLTTPPRVGDLLDCTYFPIVKQAVGGTAVSMEIILRSSYSMPNSGATVPEFDIGYLYGPALSPTLVFRIERLYGETPTAYDDLGGGMKGWIDRTFTFSFPTTGPLPTGLSTYFPDPVTLVTKLHIDGSISWSGPPNATWIVHQMYCKVTYSNGTVEYFRPTVGDTEIHIYQGASAGDYIGSLPPGLTDSGREYIYDFYNLNIEAYHTSPLSAGSDFLYFTWQSVYTP